MSERVEYTEDLIYCPHLTDDKTALAEESERRRTEKNIDAGKKHENKLWNFFYENESFTKLNSKRECKINFNGKKLRTDIVVESALCKLFVECSTENTNKKIRETINKFTQYKKLLALPKNQAATLNICQVIYLKEKPTPAMIDLIEKQKVVILTENALDYFITLAKEYKKLAYYQFLNFLFGKKEIKALKDKYPKSKISVKALEGRDPDLGEYYVFSAHPNDLIPISTVPHRKMSSIDESISKSYQRLIKKKKILGIQRHIIKNKSFPTNIIVHLNEKASFNNGTLDFTPRFGFINVIDGQHRLFSYIDEWLSKEDPKGNLKKLKKYSKNHYITVTAYKKLNPEKQIEIFVSINEKQTPVSKNLLWDLYPELFPKNHEEYYKVQVSNLAKALNNDKESKLYFKVRYPSAPYGSKSGPIDLNTICNSILAEKLYYNKDGEGDMHAFFKKDLKISDKKTVDNLILQTIKIFFDSSHDLSKKKWDNNFYMTNQYVTSFLKLFRSILRHVISVKKLVKNKDDLKETKLTQVFKKYLKPAQDHIDKMDEEQMREFKKASYGAGGPKGMWELMISKINKEYIEFEAETVANEASSKELGDIMKRLEETGETETLEAKETFFIDADKVRHTKVRVKSNDMTKDIIKTIVAMANGRGGEIVVGVGDPANEAYDEWEEVGLKNTDFTPNTTMDNYQLRVGEKIKNETSDELLQRVGINAFLSERKPFCIIKVSKIPETKLKSDSFYTMDNIAYYRRNGETTALPEESRSAHRKEMLDELKQANQ